MWLQQSGEMFIVVTTIVHSIEALAKAKPGPEKRKAAVDLVMRTWPLVEKAAHVNVDDAELEQAIGDAVDLVVHLENLMAQLQPPPPTQP